MLDDSILKAKKFLFTYATLYPPGSELEAMCHHPAVVEYVAVMIENTGAANFPATGFRKIIEEWEERPKKPLPVSLKKEPPPAPKPEPEKPRRRIGFLGTDKND